METDWRAGNIDGDPTAVMVFCEDADTTPPTSFTAVQGPRQMLLEAAPCTSCKRPFTGTGAASVICDRCNAAYHLPCARLKSVPPTYWYCASCDAHIKARGITCPTEDILFQQFLLGSKPPPELLAGYRKQAERLSFTQGKLLIWQDAKWVHFAPLGFQLLIMEETHVQHHHIGGQKMYEIIKR